MNLFLDTNILIDIAANRQPFSAWAVRIFKEAKMGSFRLFTSSFSILTTYYIIEQQIGAKQARRVIRIFLSRLEIQDCSKNELMTGLTTKFKDYEDAVQHECAKRADHIDAIITRNKKDFKESILKVLSSEELFFEDLLESNK